MKLIKHSDAIEGKFSIHQRTQFCKWQNGISIKVEESALQLYRNYPLTKTSVVWVSRQVKTWSSTRIRVELSQHLSPQDKALWRPGTDNSLQTLLHTFSVAAKTVCSGSSRLMSRVGMEAHCIKQEEKTEKCKNCNSCKLTGCKKAKFNSVPKTKVRDKICSVSWK